MDGLDPVVTLELVVGAVDAHVQRVRLSLERARRHQRHGDGSGSCIHGEPRRNRDARVDVFQHLSEEVIGPPASQRFTRSHLTTSHREIAPSVSLARTWSLSEVCLCSTMGGVDLIVALGCL